MDDSSQKPGFLERLSSLLLREPEDREQLIDLLRSAHARELLDARPRALEAFRLSLKIHPHQQDAQDAVKRLEQEMQGTDA